MQKLPLSVLIPTLNELDNLRELVPLLSFAAEIVVVDSFSEDGTREWAAAEGVRLLERVYDTPAEQKNWAIPQCACDWVLIFDADERPTTELILEIGHLFAERERLERFDAYWIGRQNHFLGRRVRYSGWQTDAVIRLIRRDVCRYEPKRVHEEIERKGLKISRLRAKMLHFTYRSLEHFVDKLQRYATWAAQDYMSGFEHRRVGVWQLYFKPVFRFWRHFLLKGGILDGRRGLIISVLMAFGVFLRYAKIMEMQQRKSR